MTDKRIEDEKEQAQVLGTTNSDQDTSLTDRLARNLRPNQELPMWVWGVTAFVAAYAIMQVQGLG